MLLALHELQQYTTTPVSNTTPKQGSDTPSLYAGVAGINAAMRSASFKKRLETLARSSAKAPPTESQMLMNQLTLSLPHWHATACKRHPKQIGFGSPIQIHASEIALQPS